MQVKFLSFSGPELLPKLVFSSPDSVKIPQS